MTATGASLEECRQREISSRLYERPTILELICLAVALGIGFWFRFADLGAASFWTDEFYTLLTVHRPLKESLLQFEDQSAPLYQLLLRPFVGNAYLTEWQLRAPAAIFGFLSIPAGWLLARALFGRAIAAPVVLLIAFNPWLVYHSREARTHSLHLLLATLSIFFFYRMMIRGRVLSIVGYVVATVLMVHAHYFGFATIALQWLFWGADWLWNPSRPRARGPLTGLVLASIGSLPAFLLISRTVRNVVSFNSGWVPPIDSTAFVSMMGELVGLDGYGALFLVPIAAAFWYRATPLDQESRCGWFTSEERQATWVERRERLLCVTWIFFGLWSFIVISLAVVPMIVLRYSLPVAVPLTILGVFTLHRMNAVLEWLIVVAVLTINWSNCVSQQTPRPSMRECVRNVLEHRTDLYTFYLVDWNYGAGYVHPDEFGAMYYGYKGWPMKLIPRGEQNVPQDLPKDRVFFLCFQTMDTIANQLISRGRRFTARHFYLFVLYEVEPVETEPLGAELPPAR
ncbi:MAG: glycosyltransferase family 39 protein [Planctomycetota bacterium]